MFGDQFVLDPELEYTGPWDRDPDSSRRAATDYHFRDLITRVRIARTHTPSQADAFSQEGSKLLIGGF